MKRKLPVSCLALLGVILAPGAALGGSAQGDTFSFHHQLGAFIDSIFQCFSEHMTGTNDNTATFDGMTELLDPYTDGTQPFIFEFETLESGDAVIEINTMAPTGTDLFPEGFMDPETGTPLTAACLEIGIDDTLDFDEPTDVESAELEFLSNSHPLFPPIDITSAFSNPWDGRLSLVFPGLAGQNINQIRLTLDTTPNEIFADGFESGDTASWSNKVP